MKKTIFILIVSLLAAVLTACGNSTVSGGETQPTDSDTASVETALETETAGQKTLVVYYSASGNTKAVAEVIARDTNGDLFELTPTQAYTEDDLNWSDPDSRVSREHDDESLRNVPLEETSVDNWEAYDTVYIGYPIWWGVAAWPVDSFVTANDFTGKTVIPFCTSSASDIGESGTLLANMAGSGNWQEGHRFRSNVSENDVSEWVKSEAAGQLRSKVHTEETETVENDAGQKENNILVAYFSRTGENYNVGTIETGNTQIIADMITEAVDADEFSITPSQPYPDDYQQMLDVLREEHKTNARPEIQNQVENMESYPIWWGDMPMIVYNFLESYDFGDKTIVPFCTHGGSGLSNTERTIASLTGTNLLPGFAIPGTTAQNEREEARNMVNKWLGDNDFAEANQIDNTDDAQAVLSAYQARLDAMVSMDIAALDDMMDDNLILRHITGDTQTKQEWLDCIANEEMRYYNIDLQNVQVEVNGDSAVVHHTAALDASIYGSRGTWTLTGDSYYAKVNGQWLWTNAPQD